MPQSREGFIDTGPGHTAGFVHTGAPAPNALTHYDTDDPSLIMASGH